MSVRRLDVRPTRRVASQRRLARLRAVGLWFVTGFDDFVIERFWARLRRGEVRGAFRVWTDLLLGWWGCALVPLVLAAVIVLIVAAVRGL